MGASTVVSTIASAVAEANQPMDGQLIDIHTSRGIPGAAGRIAIYKQSLRHALGKTVDFARHQVK